MFAHWSTPELCSMCDRAQAHVILRCPCLLRRYCGDQCAILDLRDRIHNRDCPCYRPPAHAQMRHQSSITSARDSLTGVFSNLNDTANARSQFGDSRASSPWGVSDVMLNGLDGLANSRPRSANAMRPGPDVNRKLLSAQRSMSTGMLNPGSNLTQADQLNLLRNFGENGSTPDLQTLGRLRSNEKSQGGGILKTRPLYTQTLHAPDAGFDMKRDNKSQVTTVAEVLNNERARRIDRQASSQYQRMNSGSRAVDALLDITTHTEGVSPYTRTQTPIQSQLTPPSMTPAIRSPQTQTSTFQDVSSMPQQTNPQLQQVQSPSQLGALAQAEMRDHQNYRFGEKDTSDTQKEDGYIDFRSNDQYKNRTGGNQVSSPMTTSKDNGVAPPTGVANMHEMKESGVDANNKALLANSNQTDTTPAHAAKDSDTGDKPKTHKCTWKGCDLAFNKSSDLIRHMRTHTKELPFACTWEGCDKKFSVNGILTRHMRTHTGEMPFACTWEGCTKRCSQNSDLKRHMRTHTAELPYACTFEGCGKKFSTKGNLKRHGGTHLKSK